MTTTPITPRPRLVLFDLDDTLCDYAGARVGRLRRAFGDALAQAPGGGAVDLDRLVEESIELQPHGASHFGTMFARYGIDQPELVHVADRVAVMQNGRMAAILEGAGISEDGILRAAMIEKH